MFTFAVESQLIGLAILALGIWLLVIGSNLSFLTGNSYASGAAVVVVIGVVTAIICLLGCVAGIALRKVLLVVVRQLKPLSRDSLFISFLPPPPPPPPIPLQFLLFLVLLLVLEIAAAVLGFVFRAQVGRLLSRDLCCVTSPPPLFRPTTM